MRNPTIDKTLELAAQNVHLVLERQKQEHQILITQINIYICYKYGIIKFYNNI